MGTPLNWILLLRELHKQFLVKNELGVQFSRFSKLIEKQMGLTRVVLLFREKDGFRSYSPSQRIAMSEKNPHFNHLIKKNKILTVWSGSKPKIQSVYFPILVEEDCVACYALVSKSKQFSITGEKKIFMKLLVDRTADFLEKKYLWEKLQSRNRQDVFGWMSPAMIHEIRNPLTALDTLIQLLPYKRMDDIFMYSFQKLMQREIGRLSDLTNDLLDLSNAGPEKKTMINFKKIIQQVIQLMGPLFQSKKIRLKISALKNFCIKGNEIQIKSLFINLLQNALKAIQAEGVVEISIHFLTKTPNGSNWAEIQVKDNGKGIREENLDKIFLPFFSENSLGTGLGLAICRKIVENHEGYIKVKSHPGKGTIFSIFFPLNSISAKIKNLPI